MPLSPSKKHRQGEKLAKKEVPRTLRDFASNENLVAVFPSEPSPVYITMDVYNETVKSLMTLSQEPKMDFDSTF